MNFTNTAISQKKSVRIKNLLPEMGIELNSNGNCGRINFRKKTNFK